MSSPKQKATELVEKFKIFAAGDRCSEMEHLNAKYCALIAVDEIIENIHTVANLPAFTRYWEQVRTEIDNL